MRLRAEHCQKPRFMEVCFVARRNVVGVRASLALPQWDLQLKVAGGLLVYNFYGVVKTLFTLSYYCTRCHVVFNLPFHTANNLCQNEWEHHECWLPLKSFLQPSLRRKENSSSDEWEASLNLCTSIHMASLNTFKALSFNSKKFSIQFHSFVLFDFQFSRWMRKENC